MNELSHRLFDQYASLIHDSLGIHLNIAKKDMLQSKLMKLRNEFKVQSYEAFYHFLVQNKGKTPWIRFVDEVTIHKTDFFRERNHFEHIKNNINTIVKDNPRIIENKEIRVWSAATSTGEEAYTMAMVLKDTLQNTRIKVLATDISNKVIQKAQRGTYDKKIAKDIGGIYLSKYFHKIGDTYQISHEIRNLVTFRTFNLMDPFPFKNTFDIVFCRNVMIYFNAETQKELIKKFYYVLNNGGLLFIGHSESLTGKQYKFKYIQPTIYLKPH